MPLRRRKRLKKPGLPEAVMVLLLIGTVVPATLWWLADARAEWPETGGRVVDCQIRPTHYNAPDALNKMDVTYQYSVGGVLYTGRWVGLWPQIHSPNALPRDQLDALLDKGYPLVVRYNPVNPTSSRLHDAGNEQLILYRTLAPTALVLVLFYAIKVYPAWKAKER